MYVSVHLFHSLTGFSGTAPDTLGTAFVAYEDIYDAKNAVDHLSGFNVQNRYGSSCTVRTTNADPDT